MRSAKWMYWGAQMIGWLSYGMLILLATYEDDPKLVDFSLILNIISLIFFSVAFTHLMRWTFIKMGWLELKLFPLIPRVLISSFFCSLLISVSTFSFSFLVDVEKESFNFLSFVINVFAVLVLILFWNAIYFTFHFFQKSRNQELNNITLEASRNEVELKNLRSQLNPHFLFNSLNSIRALIDIEPSKAKNSVTTLSNLLRKSLLMGRENLVELQMELEMVSHYLELEKVRFEERLTVEWDIDDRLNHFMIPPFCLQMLVENAVKHGISTMINGGLIKIKTTKEGKEVKLIVENTGKLGTKVDTGIGIKNTRRRLDIQYKDNAEFLLTENNEIVIATLIFKDENI